VVGFCASSGYREQLLKAGYVIPEDTTPAKPEPAKPKARIAPVAIPTTGPLNVTQLESVAYEVQTFHPKDSFSVPPSQKSIIGRPFDVVATLANPADSSCDKSLGGRWSYQAADGKLALSLCNDVWDSISALTDDTNFWSQINELSGLRFGRFPPASAGDEDGDYVLYAVASFNRRIGEPLWPEYAMGTKSVTMPPDQARRMTSNLRLHVYGTVKAFKGDQAVACGNGADGHTICFVTADITRLVIKDSSDGAVLATWAKRGH
jgi:hypothetical protein